MNPGKRLVVEALGTALLLATVVGSGIMGHRLAGGNVAIALLANSLATGAVLIALIYIFGPMSGAHFNPVVTVSIAWRGGFSWKEVPGYVVAQQAGAILGVLAAHLMFEQAVWQTSSHVRTGPAQWFSEFVATFGLLAVIWGQGKVRAPFTIGLYIVGAYWFTSSTSFANPAVTIARSLTDTFAGIRPQDAPGFIGAQFLGALTATALFAWLFKEKK